MISERRVVHLTPPRISAAHVDTKIICVRAHRERIFNTSMAIVDGKLIGHNYGHGGAGYTFLFGCVNESMRQFEYYIGNNPEFKDKPIVVIGAGCYGLMTAITLARAGRRVRIIARETTGLVSDNAAGFFFPRTRKRATEEEREIFERLSLESYATYLAIVRGEHPFIKQGPKIVPGYFGLDICPGFDVHIQTGLVARPEQVLIDFGNGKQYPAMEYLMVYTNPSEIMKELRAQVAALNIEVTQSVVHSINDLEEPVVFNCAGMGAKELAGDDRMVPVQGHLIMLKDQPDKEQLQYTINVSVPSMTPQGFSRDEFVYYAPKESGILGVTFLRGSKAAQDNDHEFDRMLERSRNYFGGE